MDLNKDGVDDVDQVSDCLIAKGLRFTACAWRSLWAALRGLKTLLACGALGLIGLLDSIDTVDLMATARTVFGDSAKVGFYLMMAAVGFAALRMVTKGPAAGTEQSDEGEVA